MPGSYRPGRHADYGAPLPTWAVVTLFVVAAVCAVAALVLLWKGRR